MNQIKLIVGLGNPGVEYDKTRHNIGFMVIDKFLEGMKRVETKCHTCSSYVWPVRFASRQILLQKPLTYMNLSGDAVAKICRQENILPSEVLVICDCLDLPLGRLRIRKKGGSAGQKGVADIVAKLGTENVPRLRIGIDGVSRQDQNTSDFVLGEFNSSDVELVEKVIDTAVTVLKRVVQADLNRAMNEYNQTDLRSSEETDVKNEVSKTSEIKEL